MECALHRSALHGNLLLSKLLFAERKRDAKVCLQITFGVECVLYDVFSNVRPKICTDRDAFLVPNALRIMRGCSVDVFSNVRPKFRGTTGQQSSHFLCNARWLCVPNSWCLSSVCTSFLLACITITCMHVYRMMDFRQYLFVTTLQLLPLQYTTYLPLLPWNISLFLSI